LPKAGDAEADGLRTVIDRGLDGWMHPPLLHAKPWGNSATLTWSGPSEARDLYLNVTTNPEPAEDGGFTVVNVANERVTGNSEWLLSNLRTGIYYCLLFADGSDRRVISDLIHFDIRGPDFSWLSALLL
jgi:hypothetical protein